VALPRRADARAFSEARRRALRSARAQEQIFAGGHTQRGAGVCLRNLRHTLVANANPKSLSFTRRHSPEISRCLFKQHGTAHRIAGEDRMIPVFLWLLATIDSAFIGYREAAGRNALIDKRAYYRHALIRGALMGQVAVLIVGAAVVIVSSNDAGALFSKLESIGERMLIVYVPYALILLVTFLVRAFQSVDIRSITSVLIFGPFTFIRPAVVLAGAVWGVLAAPGAITIALTALIVCLMLGLGGTLSWLRSRGLIS